MRLILKNKKLLFGDKKFVKYFKSYYKEKYDQGSQFNKIYSMIGKKSVVFPASNWIIFCYFRNRYSGAINLVGYFIDLKRNLF